MDTRTCIFLKTCFMSKTTGFLSLLHVRFSRTNPHSRFRSPLACRSFESPLVPSPETECLMDKNPVTKPNLLHFLRFWKLHEAGLPFFFLTLKTSSCMTLFYIFQSLFPPVLCGQGLSPQASRLVDRCVRYR